MMPLPKRPELPQSQLSDAELAMILADVARDTGVDRLLDVALDLLTTDVHKFLREHGL